MSLLFSKVTVTPKTGPALTFNESGHPDEYDLRELLRYEKRYAPVRDAAYLNAAVVVRLYRFQAGSRDWLAERDCFALMDSYDALALRCGEKPFIQQDDVELVEEYAFKLDLCGLCRHRGWLASDDVASCNCCDAGEFFMPDIHAGKAGTV